MPTWIEHHYGCDTPYAECESVKLRKHMRFEERRGDKPPAGWTNEGKQWFCPACSKAHATPPQDAARG